MVPILSLLLILGSSLIITRFAAVALEHTGLSRDSARFQARSAFTGVGFTTAEAEAVVSHPVRRRIVMNLMLIGNVGIVSAMAALLLSAIDLRTEQGIGVLLLVLVGGIAMISAIAYSSWVDRRMCQAIRWAIKKWTSLEVEDYSRLLHLRGEYGIARFCVQEGSWIAGKTLGDARLTDEGLLVLGIECPLGNFVGAPPRDIELRAGDDLIVYGSADRVSELASRPGGADGGDAHRMASEARVVEIRDERLAIQR